MDFDIDLQRVALAHPGTYRHQIKARRAGARRLPAADRSARPVDQLRPRTIARRGGSDAVRVQPAETLVLSRFNRRQDTVILSPPAEMRGLFEGNSVASGWTLEVPARGERRRPAAAFRRPAGGLLRMPVRSHAVPAGLAAARGRGAGAHARAAPAPALPDAYFQLRETGRATLPAGRAACSR